MAKTNKGRKLFATTATAALVASAIVPVASAAQVNDFNTVAPYAQDAVKDLVDRGVIQGDAKGNFNPKNSVTRAEAATILVGALDATTTSTINFTDVKAGAWYYDAINSAVNNGYFQGQGAGKFNPSGNLTRSEAAKILVEAFGLEGTASLNSFSDASQVKSWAKDALEIAVANGVIKGDNGKLNPNAPITRQDFAVMFSRTEKGEVEAPAVTGSVKAINNTTVEVEFKDAVTELAELDFKIEGLEVTNKAIKQTNAKTVVLTTAPQTAGTTYAVSVNGEKVGSFAGISAVVPTKVELVSTSVQGKLGQQVTVQAKVTVAEGQSAAGIPVTFTVPGNNNDAVNPTLTGEANTDANGVATYTYTRYTSKTDIVTAYSTGDRSKFATGYVFWGVDTILAIQEVTEGATINNGANKTYKVTFKDDVTGKPKPGVTLNVSALENINVTANKTQNVTVNGVVVKQLSNGTNPVAAQIMTDSKGEATFTVSGTNAEVTPVVFEAERVSSGTYSETYDASYLQATTAKVKFAAVQTEYKIEVTRDGGEVAATGFENGREYNVVVKDKDGKVAKNEVVNVAFNEDLDRVISTNTDSYFVESDSAGNRVYTPNLKQVTITTDEKGEASFIIANDAASTYATPVAWIDINSAYVNKQGNLDEGEPKTVAAISYFEAEYLDGAALKVKNANGRYTTAAASLKGDVAAEFRVDLVNQSGETTSIGSVGEVTYTITNTGSSVIYIGAPGLTTTVADADKISPNRSKTIKLPSSTVLQVSSYDGESGSVKVVATGKATHAGKDFNFVAKEATAKFTSLTAVTNLEKGNIASFNTGSKTLTISGKSPIKYAGVADKTINYRDEDNRPVSLENFEKALQAAAAAGTGALEVTYEVKGDEITFYLKALTTGTAPADTVADAAAAAAADAAAAAAVDTLIAALTATSTTSNILAAHTAYDGLTATRKALVKAANVTALEAAITTAITGLDTAVTALTSTNYTATTWTAVTTAQLLPETTLAEKATKLTALDTAKTALAEAVAVTISGATLTFTDAITTATAQNVTLNTTTWSASTTGTSAAVASTNTIAITIDPAYTPAANDTVTLNVTVKGITTDVVVTYVGSAWTITTPASGSNIR